MGPSQTGGCSPLATIASAANQPDIVSLNFSQTTQQFAQFAIPLPKRWDRGTITARFRWSHPATTTNFGVVWSLQAVAVSDNEAIAAAYGTAQQIADTGGTTSRLYVTSETPAITVGGSPADGDTIFFRVARVPADASDTMAVTGRLLDDMDAVANRVRRVATGWEAVLTVAVDSVVSRTVVMDLCAAFLALGAPTRLRLRHETLSGTLAALTSGQADLALGVVLEPGLGSEIQHAVLGDIPFVYAVASHHPLAQAPEPLDDATLQQHRAVAVADSVSRGAGLTIGLLAGQDVFTVPDMASKLEAQLRGLGGGSLPESLARPYIDAGMLVVKKIARPRTSTTHYAWRDSRQSPAGHALRWWLEQLG